MKIRKAKPKDKKELLKMMFDLCKYENAVDKKKIADEKTLNFLKRNINLWLKNKKYIFYVAEENEKLIGYVFGWKEEIHEVFRNNFVGYICDVYVIEQYRNKNFGKKLVENLISYFRKKGLSEIKLYVLSKNRKALSFWEKMSFKELNKEMRKEL